MTDTVIQLSENETNILGIRVGRCNAESFDEKQLQKQALQMDLDLCRLKTPSEDEYASLKLIETGFPFFFSGSIRRYKTRITEIPEGNFIHPEIEYVLYDGSQDDIFKELLKDTWGTYPLGYYRTPLINHFTSKEQEIETVYQFYKQTNLSGEMKESTMVFMMDKGRCVGFFALNIVDGNLESHIGGIHSEYRKGGYFLDMLRYIKIYCVENQLPYFLFGARNENAEVQKIFRKVGFQSHGTENVFHIASLLSVGNKNKRTVNFKCKPDYSIIRMEVYKILSQAEFKSLAKAENFSLTFLQSPEKTGLYTIEIRQPDIHNGKALSLLKLVDNQQKMIAFGYLY